MAGKRKKKTKKKQPPRKVVPRKMRWWDYLIIGSGFVIAFAFLLWAGSKGGLVAEPELPEGAITPTAVAPAAAGAAEPGEAPIPDPEEAPSRAAP